MMEHHHGFHIGNYECKGKEAIIGRGSFADVFRGTNVATNEVVAIKVVDVARLTRGNEKLKQHLISEIEIMRDVDHANIVKFFDVIAPNEFYVYMIFEFCAGGDFSKYLHKQKGLSETKAQYFMRHLASGLKFLRSKNIIHRDLKPQNLLLSSKDDNTAVLKIADFGFARLIEPQSVADTLCGSPLYMAPEILKLQKYTVKADLWSVGCILYEMLTGHPPYPVKSHFELLQMIDKKKVTFPPHLDISPECKNLVESLMQHDPMKRISWEEFFLHPWLNLHPILDENEISAPPTFLTNSGSINIYSSISSNQPINIPIHHSPVLNSLTMPLSGSPFSVPSQPINIGFMTQNTNLVGSPSPPIGGLSTTPLYGSQNKSAISGNFPSSLPNQLNSNAAIQNRQKSNTFHGVSPSPNPIMNKPFASNNNMDYPPIISPRNNANSSFGIRLSGNNSISHSNSPPDPSKDRMRANSLATDIRVPKTRPFKDDMVSPANSKLNTSGLSTSKSLEENQNMLFDRRPIGDNRGYFISSENSRDEETRKNLDMEMRGKRALLIAGLGDIRSQSESGYSEALALYIKSLALLSTILYNSRKLTHSQSLNDSSSLSTNSVLSRFRESYFQYLKKAELLKQYLKSTAVTVVAEKLIYDFALQFGREGAVHEMMKHYEKSDQYYENGVLLMEQLFSEVTSEKDKDILQTYISSFLKRLNQSKMSQRSNK